MKQLFYYCLAFISFICVANGQGQQGMHSMLSEKTMVHKGEPMQWHQLNNRSLQIHKKQTNSFNYESVRWDWDTIFTYDTSGLQKRITRTYNNGNISTEFSEHWKSNAWENSSRETFTYDPNGNMVTDLYEYWQNNVWVNSWKGTYTYDANGNMLTSLNEDWNNNAWRNSGRNSYTYDGNGNRLTNLWEQWQNNAWVIDSKETYTYDGNGNMLTSLLEVWLNNTWVNSYKDTYTYDGNGNWITRFSEDWENNAWVNSQNSTITYDGSGNMLTFLYEFWQNNMWVNDNRFTITYDGSGNMLTVINEVWPTNTWLNFVKYTYSYDANGNSLTGKCEIWQSDEWQPGIANYYTINLYSQKHEIYYLFGIYRYEASYIPLPGVGTTDLQANNYNLYVFPNPATERITVEYSSFKENKGGIISIYTIQGLSILQQPFLREKSEIDINWLAKGIYIVQVRSGEKNEVSRFLKE